MARVGPARRSRPMSRAFVREGDGEPGPLPERALSPHPNLVTPGGLRAIEARVRELEGERQAARAADDEALRARVGRDLRYWRAPPGGAPVVRAAGWAGARGRCAYAPWSHERRATRPSRYR